MVPDEQTPESVIEPAPGSEAGERQETDPLFPVVAIGASAGGLEAFTTLLRHLPTDSGMAFVFIQHLAPSHESMLAHLLSRETAMPVEQIEDGALLSPDHVFVIPPNTAITVSGLALALTARVAAGTAVDGFLRSLAASHKSRAIAVILSGTGSDGALGVQAIAEDGGVVFAQEPQSAKFDGMPRSAIATGCVDFVLPVEAIATELARISHEPRLIERDPPEVGERPPDSEREFQTIGELLRSNTGIDFSLYRQATVRRRVQRRVAVLKQRGLRDYVEYVRENPEEAHALAQDILIRVTRFFRDSDTFDTLSRKVFPALIRKTPHDRAVRIWVAGCSTGEEAYSIGMCFAEVAEQMKSRVPIQVFATDINEAAIEKARRGTYLDNIVADLSQERLSRFFVREGRGFQIGRRLRDMCIFSRHDLLSDPPFSRMGLVSCRNVLIYLDHMQEQALSRFHFALDPGGFLLLGKSETATSSPGLFATVDRASRLYVRQDAARHFVPVSAVHHREAAMPAPQRPRPQAKIDLCRQADRVMTERYGPPRVIVDTNLDVIAYGNERVSFAPDISNEQLVDLAKQSQSSALKNAIRTAAKTGESVGIERVKLDGIASSEISIHVTPLAAERLHFLLVFETGAMNLGADLPSGAPERKEDRRQADIRVARLGKELAAARGHLESVIIEQEAAHEEVVAANEELQSLNEELESSKEELEAANEELTTVNQELQVRNAELESAREFAQATIDTVRGALVVLGSDLRVIRANQSFYRTFRLSPQDVEHRFIYEVGDGRWGNPQLRVLLEEVLPERRDLKDFEVHQDVPSEGVRVVLLNARRFEGEDRILLAIEDVTQLRRTEEELRQSQKMEAIGFLAAGVAHDFNNLLTGMIGNASLLLDSLPESQSTTSTLQNIISGGERAAELTRQLLAYAGKGRFYLERLDLSQVVIQTGRLIHPSIPPNVQVRLDLDKHLPLLLADPGQIQQIVMNLMINAAEAVGEQGGVIQVRTGRQTVGDESLPDLFFKEAVVPGNYVFLEVRDNGSGMNEQTIQKIFDPFFTTKFTGRGLGLAAVLGIVRQHKGAIQLHSVPGRGTSFRVLLCVGEKEPTPVSTDISEAELRGSGTVLVIDDEELIRSYCKAALASYGYNVLLARNGAEGIRQFQEKATQIGLVLLDVATPGMDGSQTLERIRQVRSDVPVVVCSGFGDMDVEARFAGKQIAGFFPKPYTVKQLARKVKECIVAVGRSA
ncbi:MAG TPA: chemotaxis protein CheB [Candidatus Limnocylindrales bacterium]|nr:chemotaxis protein CheB [Candidatus Limnocylindrales bacterium]